MHGPQERLPVSRRGAGSRSSSVCLAAPRPGQHVPGVGPSGPGCTEAPSSGRERRTDRRDVTPCFYISSHGSPRRCREAPFGRALVARSWPATIAPDRPAGEGQPRARTVSEPAVPETQESPNGGHHLIWKAPLPSAPGTFPGPLVGPLPRAVQCSVSMPREPEASRRADLCHTGQLPPAAPIRTRN